MDRVDALGDPLPPFRWSFSQWENYNGCPARWKFRSILRLPSLPSGPAAARGTSLHARCDQYILGQIDQEYLVNGDSTMRFGDKKPAVIHPKYIPVLDAFKNHENGDRGTEKKCTFDSSWSVVPPTGKNTACVMVLDAYRFGGARNSDDDLNKVLRIAEWKSGSPKDTHPDQRNLYALAGIIKWGCHTVEVTTYYLEDTHPPVRLRAHHHDDEKIKAKWQQRIELMQRDEMCAPRPGAHCNWCDYAKKRGGPCQFGG